MAPETLMNLREAAEYLKVAPNTLYKWTSKMLIPFSKPNGRVLYFRREDLDQWANQNRVVPANWGQK